MSTTADTQRFLKAVTRATQRGHDISYEIREHVSASRRLFFEDLVGRDYLDALDLGGMALLPGTRLPRVNETGRLDPDEIGDPRTGNVLLFVVETDAIPTVSDPVAGTVRHIDAYRFICVYPSLTDRFVVTTGGKKEAVDLVVWQSVEFPSFRQIMGITDPTERAYVLADLVDKYGFTTAWDPSEPVESSFYRFGSIGTISATPDPGVTILEDVDVSQRGRLVYAHSQLARTDASNYHRRPIFTVDDPASWKPDGFEVKIVGSSGSRLVWVHLVVEVEATRGQVAAHASSLTASVRDL